MKRNYSSPPRWTTLAPIAILLLVQCSLVAHAVSSSPSASSSISSRSTRSSRSQQQRYRSSSSSSWLDTDIDSNHRHRRILRHQWHHQTHALFHHHIIHYSHTTHIHTISFRIWSRTSRGPRTLLRFPPAYAHYLPIPRYTPCGQCLH